MTRSTRESPRLGITRLTLTELIGNEVHQRLDERPAVTAGKLANIAHRADRPSGRLASAVVSVELVPKRYGVVVISYAATIVVAAALTLIVIARGLRDLILGPIPVGSAAGSLLLATGGILLTWISRTPEDWMVAKILRDPRRHLVASAGLLLAASCLMAAPVAEPIRTLTWFGLVVAAWAVVSRSWIYRKQCRVASSTSTDAAPLPF